MSHRRSLLHKKNGSQGLFDDADVVYSQRKFYNCTHALLKVYRESDLAEAWVFFNGEVVNTSSVISTVDAETPSATTILTWLGGSTARILLWYGQTPDSLLDTDKIISYVSGSAPTLNFSGASSQFRWQFACLFKGIANTALDSGNSFSIFTVTANLVSNNISNILSTRINNSGTNSRLSLYNDSSTNNLIANIRNTSSTNQLVNLLAQQNTTSNKLLTLIATPSEANGYYNDVLQDTTALSGSYDNEHLELGSQFNGTSLNLNGFLREIIIFPSDKTSKASEIHDNINAYYSIY